VALVFSLVSASAIEAASQLISWGSTNYGLANVPPVSNVAQLCIGEQHGLLLTTDGKVMAWGGGFVGQTNIPSDLGKVLAVSAGANHNLALLADGSVRAWGDNTYGQCAVPDGLRAVAISGGATFSAAIRTDGTPAVWGFTGVNPPLPAEFTNLVKIAAGDFQILAQRGDGQVLSWGGGVPPEATNVTMIAVGSLHNLVLRSDGSVIAWGNDNHGQVQVPPNLGKVISIAAGGYRSIVLLSDGTVQEWGDTQWFTRPGGVTNVTLIAAGQVSTIVLGALLPAVTAQPISQSVSSGNSLQLHVSASGTPPLRFQWQHDGSDIPAATDSTFVTPASQHTDAGIYRVIVSNDIGTTTSTNAVVSVVDTKPAVSVASPAVAIFRGGRLDLNGNYTGSLPMSFQWQKDGVAIPFATNASLSIDPVPADGAGNYLVVVTNEFGFQRGPPIAVALLPIGWWGAPVTGPRSLPLALTNAVTIAVRDWNTAPTGIGLLADGQLITWGSSAVTRVPPGASNTVAVSAGDAFVMALGFSGKVTVWGYSQAGQANVPPSLSGVVAISAGSQHCLALKGDGTVVGWGDNWFGQAHPPAGLRNVVAIAAGFAHSVALRSDGTVVSWGVNIFGETNVPSGLSGVVMIAAGGDHTLCLKSDGSVVAFGQNSLHQTEVPSGLSNVVALSASDTYSMALCGDGSLVLWGSPGVVTNVPGGLTGLQAIYAANNNAYALLGDGQPITFAKALAPVCNQSGFSTSFDGERGSAYRLESSDHLPADAWKLSVPVPSDGTRATIMDSSTLAPSCFYTIRRLR